MTQERETRRRHMVYGLSGLAAVLALGNLAGRPNDSGYLLTEREGQLVFPRLARRAAAADTVRITIPDQIYTMVRDETFDDRWLMAESGGYPVRADMMAALTRGLTSMEWGLTRTSDADKLDRIGLGNPETGGTGARIDILSERDSPLASLITGRKGDRLYARFSDENKSFRVTGDLPPLYRPQTWLDLDIIDMQEDAIGAVRITDRRGRGVFVTRPPGSSERAFRLAPPYQNDTLVSRNAIIGPALALSRLTPVDVRPAEDLETRSVGQHITTTHDGLEIAVAAYAEADGYFVTLRAIVAGEGAARAQTINARSEGWAFELDEIDWREFTPSVRSIIRRREPTSNPPTP
ncbi:MAG: DUF4340 domain-containing protein [Pseudomonadota bacterium]